jgi:translation initiation factor 3 subunit H
MATQSMAAALAASLPAPVLPQAEAQPQVTKVPQRLEGVVDPEALRDVESVSLNSLVCRLSTWTRRFHRHILA